MCDIELYIILYHHQRAKMNECYECRGGCLNLRTENEILRAEKEEAEERQERLRRQLDIMMEAQEKSQSDKGWGQEIDRLRQEIIGLLGEKQQLQRLNRAYLQKIQDLKYHNGQLKKLNQKMGELHNREIEMMKRQSQDPEQLREAEEREKAVIKEKEFVAKQLQEVVKVAAEMEEYYVGEFKKKNEQLLKKDQQIDSLSEMLENSKNKHHQVLKEVQRQWQRHLAAVQGKYEEQIAQLKNKIGFLVSKIDNQEDCQSKPSLGALSVISDMIQSKMVQSSSSAQSFKMDLNDHITRRNTSGSKTPSKYSRKKY